MVKGKAPRAPYLYADSLSSRAAEPMGTAV
jgi:hypothetical protein